MINRVEHKTKYTVIDNGFLQDPRLNIAQKGLLTVMLSMPDDWVFHINPLKKLTGQGNGALERNLKALERNLKALEQAGYLVRNRVRRGQNGRFSGPDWTVNERTSIPYIQNPHTGNRNTENGEADNGYMENDALLHTNKQITDRSNISQISTDLLSIDNKADREREASVLEWLESFKHRK